MHDSPSWKKFRCNCNLKITYSVMWEWGLRPWLLEKLLGQGRAVLWTAQVQTVAAAPAQQCCGDSVAQHKPLLCNPSNALEGRSLLAKGGELGGEALERTLCTPALGYCAINIRTRPQRLWCTWQGLNLSWGCPESVLMLLFIYKVSSDLSSYTLILGLFLLAHDLDLLQVNSHTQPLGQFWRSVGKCRAPHSL